MSYSLIERAVQNADRDWGVSAAWICTNWERRQNVRALTAGLLVESRSDPVGTA